MVHGNSAGRGDETNRTSDFLKNNFKKMFKEVMRKQKGDHSSGGEVKRQAYVKKMSFPWWLSDKKSICQCRRHGFDPDLGRPHMPWSN